MIVFTIYGGLVSQIKAFYLVYRVAYEKNDKLILDLSQFYEGYYQPYLLDYLNIPNSVERIVMRGDEKQKIQILFEMYESQVKVIRDGDDLEEMYLNYNPELLYFLVNDSYLYDSFCEKNKRFYYRYHGNDVVTQHICSLLSLKENTNNIRYFEECIYGCNSVGIHIRLRDFIKVGWMVEKDYDFYRAAIQWFRKHVDNTKFFVFSDDIDGAKCILGGAEDINYVRIRGGSISDVEELVCLSKCKHRILTKKSNYSLFASFLADKVWRIEGYTLIIENMSLADNTDNAEYINRRYHQKQGGLLSGEYGEYISLSRREIEEYSQAYPYFSNPINELWNKKNVECEPEGNIHEIEAGIENAPHNKEEYLSDIQKDIFVFCTLQSYSDVMCTGMQHMAYYLARMGKEVHFVGGRGLYDESRTKMLEWTFEQSKRAEDRNSNDYGFVVYPYDELNKREGYADFFERIRNDSNKKIIAIVRKPSALPKKEKHRNETNIKYIYVDFEADYGKEKHTYSENELKYLYSNADKVITFDSDVYEKWKEVIDISLVNISRIYPRYLRFEEKVKSPMELRMYEEKLYEQLNCIIYDAVYGEDK